MKKDKILVVDDDESIRNTLEMMLRENYTVLKAGTGEEALKILSRHQILVILLDIHLPGISGIQTLGRIRRQYPEAQCIMISADRNPEAIVEYTRMGAYGYMTKKLDYDLVRLKVWKAMDCPPLEEGVAEVSSPPKVVDRFLLLLDN